MIQQPLLFIFIVFISCTSFSHSTSDAGNGAGLSISFGTVSSSESRAQANSDGGAVADDRIETATTVHSDAEYLLSEKVPYTPRDTEYSIEFGAMAERRSLYWVGASIGQHIGRCLLTSSQTCQQYIDGIAGVGGRDAETFGLFLGSLRWQFVNFPRSWSPLIRLAAGPMRVQAVDEDGWRFVYGVGIGAIAFLHDKVDLRGEARILQGDDHTMGQAMLSIHFKADRLIGYFGEKLEELLKK